jgi:hypothetical protein
VQDTVLLDVELAAVMVVYSRFDHVPVSVSSVQPPVLCSVTPDELTISGRKVYVDAYSSSPFHRSPKYTYVVSELPMISRS